MKAIKLLVFSAILSFAAVSFAGEIPDINPNTVIESPLLDVGAGEVEVIPATADQVMAAVGDLITARNMGTVAVVLAVVQLLMAIIRSTVGELVGRWKVTTLIFLTIMAGTLAGIVEGGSVGASIMTAILIIPPQITIHQLHKQYLTVKGST